MPSPPRGIVIAAPSAIINPWTATALIASVGAFYASARSLQVGDGVAVITATTAAANLATIAGGRFYSPLAPPDHAATAVMTSACVNTYPVLAPIRVTAEARSAARTLADELRARDGIEVGADALLDSPHVFFGTIEQLVGKCLGLRERFGISYIAVAGEAEAFAPVVERLAGR